MTHAKTALICAGGTGGHVMPAKALIEALQKKHYSIIVATDARGKKYYEGLTNIDLHILPAATYRSGLMGKLSFLVPVIQGLWMSQKLIQRSKPSIAIGFGGYPTVPPMLAAQIARVPTLLHEQNALLGLANKILLPFCTALALSFVPTKGIPANYAAKAKLIGNPVRSEILERAKQEGQKNRSGDRITILIVGGSQGAKVFSDKVPHAFLKLPPDLRQKIHLVHQVQEADQERISSLYKGAGLSFELKSFFEDMPTRLHQADLLISRSGASTVSEVNVMGRAALYVPYPHNRDDQQGLNAQTVQQSGGAILIREKDLDPDSLADLLASLIANPVQLQQMGAKAKSLAKESALSDFAHWVDELSL
jgi:UDP-N-acetylglucosamine--N-acetylmuramyl-(pentapeptide) pyrophosphoryl-undecaprenol N-acetylglucosamine transferase